MNLLNVYISRDFDYLNPFLESRKTLHLLAFLGPLVLGKPLVKKMRVYMTFCQTRVCAALWATGS